MLGAVAEVDMGDFERSAGVDIPEVGGLSKNEDCCRISYGSDGVDGCVVGDGSGDGLVTRSVEGANGAGLNACDVAAFRSSSPPPGGPTKPGDTRGDGNAEVDIELDIDGAMEFWDIGRESRAGRIDDLVDGDNTRARGRVVGGCNDDGEAPEKARREEVGRSGEGVPGLEDRRGTWRKVDPDGRN